jgi:cyclomaltodextrinase
VRGGGGRGRSALAVSLLVGCFVAASCTDDGGAGSRSSQTETEPAVTFNHRGGDAFSWSQRVSGRADCSDVQLVVNGQRLDVPVTTSAEGFAATVPLESGRNEVFARCAQAESARDESEPLVINGRLRPRPTAKISVSVSGDAVTFDARRSQPTQPDGTKITRYLWKRDLRHPVRLTTVAGDRFTEVRGRRLRLRAPASDGEYYVSLEVTDARGRFDTSTSYFVVEGGRARPVDMMHEHPSWIDRAVIYAPIPDLWGGGPEAVTKKLPYLKTLGVDALWLWPPATERAFGEEYAITDYFKLDPSWGPKPAFRRMVEEAHRLGLYVLLDIVPNHMSVESPYFKDAKRFEEASPYWEFFDRNAQGKPTHYFDWSHLPNLNYDNPEVRRMITEAFAYWVRDLGIDGFRVDVAWGVRRRRPTFWPQLRRELKRINPDILMLAEASAVHSYYFANGFDVAYDWSEQPGQWPWMSAFQFPQETGALLAPLLSDYGTRYVRDAVVMRFLNNNDTGIRFIDQYGARMQKVAATMQFTVPGIPAMFAGDEIGASYQPYSSLEQVPWKDRHGLRPVYRKLIRLKHEMATLNSKEIVVLTPNSSSVLAYIRPAVGSSPPVLVLLNYGEEGRVSLELTPALESVVGPTGGVMRDLLTNKDVRLEVSGDEVTVRMAKESALLMVPGSA